MNMDILKGLLIPFIGTSLGAAGVFFMKKELSRNTERILLGFAAGVMIAASVWSLLIPALEQASGMGVWSFIPAVIGFWLGILFLLFLDRTVPHVHRFDPEPEGRKSKLQKTILMVLAVTMHNIPEGMAVGAVFVGVLAGDGLISMAAALTLAIGIAIQNFPEGAVISMPLHSEGMSRSKSFAYGVFSGAVEPLAAVMTILLADLIIPALPYFLSFAAGAMIYVVTEELIPEMSEPPHSNIGTLALAFGFTLMMTLDVVFS